MKHGGLSVFRRLMSQSDEAKYAGSHLEKLRPGGFRFVVDGDALDQGSIGQASD
jgi:hypothetical protein